MKIKKFFVKLLVCILIFLTLVNFMGSINIDLNYSFAGNEEGENRINEMVSGGGNWLVDIIFHFIKWMIVSAFRAIRSIIYLLASAGGTNGAQTGEITPFDIFFNRFVILDANIFSNTDRLGNPLDTDSLVYKIRTNAAIWYYAVRTLSISIITIMLLWNLIRSISKNTTADQKAVAKNSLTDWVLSFALVMFMHIIVIIILNFNDLILSGIESFTPLADTGNFFDALENTVFSSNFILSISAMAVYALLLWQTFKYILIYIQRLLTIVLLVMISPIVPVTYSTNRMRGGRGGALNGWLKELVLNVFIQTLHAVVYAALVGVAMAALTGSSINAIADILPGLIAIAAMLSVKYMEKMVKSIFGFDSSQILNNNVIMETAQNIGYAASNVVGAGARAINRTTGMVMPGVGSVPFGQNVGNLGTGTQGNSIFNSVGNSIRTAGSNLMGGLRNNRTANGSTANTGLLGRVADTLRSGKDGEDGSASAFASAEAYAEIEENGENDVIEPGFIDLEEKENEDARQNSKDREQDETNLRQDEKDREQDKTNKAQNDRLKGLEEQVGDLGQSDDPESKLKDAVAFTNRNTENKTEEVIEEHTEETETTLENSETIEIPVDVGGGISQEAVDELKSGIEAIKNENIEKLEQMATDLDKKLEEIGSKLEDDVKSNIESNIEKLINNPKELAEYINSLPKDSKERKYAEAYAKFNTIIDLSDSNMTGDLSKEEKSQMLINTFKATGMQLPENLSMNDVSKLKAVPSNNESDGTQTITMDSKSKIEMNSSEISGKVEESVVQQAKQAYEEAVRELEKVGIQIESTEELKEFYKVIAEKTEGNTSSLTQKRIQKDKTGNVINKTNEAVELIKRAEKEGYTLFSGEIVSSDGTRQKLKPTNSSSKVITQLQQHRRNGKSNIINLDEARKERDNRKIG